MNGVAVTGFAFWTASGVFLDTLPDFGGPGGPLSPWPEAPSLAEIHPKARRPHVLAIGLVRLTHALLERRAQTAPSGTRLPASEGLGMLLGTVSGSRLADEEFERGLDVRGAAFGSPSAFVYTLSTSAPAEVTLALGPRGPLSTLSMGALSGAAALVRGAAQVRRGQVPGLLCGAIELPGAPGAGVLPPRAGLALFLLERVEGASPWPTLESCELGSAEGRAGEAEPPDPLAPLAELAAAVLAARFPTGRSQTLGWGSPSGPWVRLRVVPSTR